MADSTFAKVLSADRSAFNAHFEVARQQWPSLDGEAFKIHLREVVAPIVEAAARVREDRAHETTKVLYELSLELMGRGWVGPGARFPAIESAWRTLLPAVPHLLVQAPREVAAGISNALHTISSSPQSNPLQWIEQMHAVGALWDDIPTWHRAGTIAAWRCGLAHFRRAALVHIRALNPSIAQAALGIPNVPPELWPVVVRRLANDPWFDPTPIDFATADAEIVQQRPPAQMRVRYCIGAFTGFGGSFSRPPLVSRVGENFWVWNGKWRLLCADAFGATIQNAPAPPNLALSMICDAPWHFDPTRGHVRFGSGEIDIEFLQNAASFAGDFSTLVVTIPISHAVYILAPC